MDESIYVPARARARNSKSVHRVVHPRGCQADVLIERRVVWRARFLAGSLRVENGIPGAFWCIEGHGGLAVPLRDRALTPMPLSKR